MIFFNKATKLCVLLSLILLVFTTQANAQSNVTMYGNIDISANKVTGSSHMMGPGYFNWLGIKGNEALSSDLQTVFNLQMRFNPGTGALSNAGTFWQGESTLGLKSATLGTIRLGRATTPMWSNLWQFEPWGNGTANATLSAYQTGSFSSDGVNDVANNFATFARINNSVFYDSPSWSGFHVSAAGEVEEATGASARNKGISVNYTDGPLNVMLSYERNHESDSIGYLGVTYALGGLTLMGSYAHTEVLNVPPEKMYLLAATYALGSSDTIRTGYGRNQASGNHKTSLGYIHALSKRTNVYADLWREVTIANQTGYALGINHAF